MSKIAKQPAPALLRLGQTVYVSRHGEMTVGRLTHLTRSGVLEGMAASVVVHGVSMLYPLDSVFVSKRHFVAGERAERRRAQVAKAERAVARSAERWVELVPPRAGDTALRRAVATLAQRRRRLARDELRCAELGAKDGAP